MILFEGTYSVDECKDFEFFIAPCGTGSVGGNKPEYLNVCVMELKICPGSKPASTTTVATSTTTSTASTGNNPLPVIHRNKTNKMPQII